MGILSSDIPISSGKIAFSIKCLKLGYISCGIGTKLKCAKGDKQSAYFHGGHAGESYYYFSNHHWEEGALCTFIGSNHTDIAEKLTFFKEGEILTVSVDMEGDEKKISFSKEGEDIGSLNIPGDKTYYMVINLKPEDESEWQLLKAE